MAKINLSTSRLGRGFQSCDDEPANSKMSLSNPFSQSGSASPQTSADVKSAIITQVQQEAAVNNARSLIT
ncbi:hypothetical protein ACJ73_09506, partial [Blastomyces percursus]